MKDIIGRKDLYNNKEKFDNWLRKVDTEAKIDELNESNYKIVITFIKDFRYGLNVSIKSKKGERGYHRLNSLRQKITFIFKLLEKRGIVDVREAKAEDLHRLFSDMKSGIISTRNGTAYKSTGDYVKEFKTFWHWHQKVSKKQGTNVPDICEELDRRGEKPKFVYFTKDDFNVLIAAASADLKPILALAFDSGVRVTELLNVKVSDLINEYRELNIREETAKTFGRRMKLMICSQQVKEYVEKLGLQSEEFLSRLSAPMINKELNKLGKKFLTPEQIKYKNLTLYDFRHSSACYWLPIYKTESAMKYRFGWKRSEMIHYYTEFLGMKDTITQDDLYIDITKTELERQLQEEQRKRELIEARLKTLEAAILTQATQQGSPIHINTPRGTFAASISGTAWQDEGFKPVEEYSNG